LISALKRKRILLVFVSLELGGAERQGMHLARHLKSLGCDVIVWGLLGTGLVKDLCRKADILCSIHHFNWPCRKSSLIKNSWNVLRALRQEKPDVILTYTTRANMSCGLTWRFSSAKVCIWGQRNVNDLLGHPLERHVYKRISGVVCNAQHQVDYLRKTLGETPAPISVIHNGVALAPIQKARMEWRKELHIDQSAIAATMVANFRPQKDHVTLLHAWRKMLSAIPDSYSKPRLLLAGAPQQSYEAVYQLASDLALLDTVKFIGQVQDISGLLSASDIGVLTSTHEGLSNSLLEYMASGLPVVVTDLPGNREALGDNFPQQLCHPGDVDNLAELLRALFLDSELRGQLGSLNQARALKEFSLESMCDKMTNLIGALLEKSGPGRRARS